MKNRSTKNKENIKLFILTWRHTTDLGLSYATMIIQVVDCNMILNEKCLMIIHWTIGIRKQNHRKIWHEA